MTGDWNRYQPRAHTIASGASFGFWLTMQDEYRSTANYLGSPSKPTNGAHFASPWSASRSVIEPNHSNRLGYARGGRWTTCPA